MSDYVKRRVFTLNQRDGAKHRWPGFGSLAGDGEKHGEYEYCCIGINLLVCGVPVEKLVRRGFSRLDDHPEWLVRLWNTPIADVPDEIMGKVRLALGSELAGKAAINSFTTVEGMAANINDHVAAGGSVPQSEIDRAVDALRIIFRWLGEQVDEQWIIRHLKPEVAV